MDKNVLIKYGTIISDEEKEVNHAYVRIRKIEYNNEEYIHIMVNGECIYCAKEKLFQTIKDVYLSYY